MVDEVATLGHEFGDDAMEGRVFVAAASYFASSGPRSGGRGSAA